MKIGIDIVEVKDFEKAMQNGADSFMMKNFSKREVEGVSTESLAGKFACKEAAFKAAVRGAQQMQDIEVLKDPSGAPYLFDVASNSRIENVSVSISHNKSSAVAVVINFDPPVDE